MAKKVRKLWAMAFKWPKGAEYNIRMDAVSSAITFYDWPTPVEILDFYYGYGMRCGLPMARQPKVGFNPAQDVYAEAVPKNLWGKRDGHPAWDEVTVLFAVRGWERFCTTIRGRFDIVNLGICDNNATANIDDCALRSLPTGRILTAPVVLDEDTDWSDEQIYLASSASVDLAGHALTLGAFHCEADGARAITDTSSGQPGELRLVPAAGETSTFYRSVGGNLKVVKAGDGRVLWRGGYIDAAVPVIITNGVFREEVYHKNAFGTSGTITVADKGQFDLNWAVEGATAPVQKRTFYIEGDGPDGTGALVNNAASSIYGYHCSRVILTGDATLGGTARIDFRGTCSLEGAGYDLTIKNTGMVAFCSGKADLSAKNVIVRDGGIFQPCSNDTGTFAIEGAVQLVNGGKYKPYSDKNVTMNLNMPVVVGDGGGVMASDSYWYSQKAALLVQTGRTLNLGNEGGWFAVESSAMTRVS